MSLLGVVVFLGFRNVLPRSLQVQSGFFRSLQVLLDYFRSLKFIQVVSGSFFFLKHVPLGPLFKVPILNRAWALKWPSQAQCWAHYRTDETISLILRKFDGLSKRKNWHTLFLTQPVLWRIEQKLQCRRSGSKNQFCMCRAKKVNNMSTVDRLFLMKEGLIACEKSLIDLLFSQI